MSIRREILDALKKEIIGPANSESYKDEVTGEEILLSHVHGAPQTRYGAAILYPQKSNNIEICDSGNDNSINNASDGCAADKSKISNKTKYKKSNCDDIVVDEEPVGLANQYFPSAMGFTVRINNDAYDAIKITVNSAYYEKSAGQKVVKTIDKNGKIENKKYNRSNDLVLSDYWVRRPIGPRVIQCRISNILNPDKKDHKVIIQKFKDGSDWLALKVINRSTELDKNEGYSTVSFTIVNCQENSTSDKNSGDKILYQNEMILETDNYELIAPYKERILSTDTLEEEELKLLYRNKRIFAIGHGASVAWDSKEIGGFNRTNIIKTSVLPEYDIAQIAPTSYVELSMLELSDMGDWKKALISLNNLVKEYSEWINKIEDEIRNKAELYNYRNAALQNVEKCRKSLKRIIYGCEILSSSAENSDIIKSFRWMNHAMLWQQQRSKTNLREWKNKDSDDSIELEKICANGADTFFSLEEYYSQSEKNGRWRPFQLAFILMNIRSICDVECDERKIVDLIWFPTGGGKTEAYLGLAALTIFYRRMQNNKNIGSEKYNGTAVIMRYTLRLLTAQQYERASSLICACDIIRQKHIIDLGLESISIGLWVGGMTTPNTNKEAIRELNKLKKNKNEKYNFVVLKCPCCGAQIGKINLRVKKKIVGINKKDGNAGEVYFSCENKKCEYYNKKLPMEVIDELIYSNPPTLLLGTVDKFAMITWKAEAGCIFGFRDIKGNVKRIVPPELIIQDELHLISGPLGTIVGLYESMIQNLCNNYDKGEPPFVSKDCLKGFIPPKIVASSATISRSYEQVKSLYGIDSKEKLNIFPPQGLEFGNTWFSEEKSLDKFDSDGKQIYPGRRYVGILASGYPSAQTAIVRAYSSVLQKVNSLIERYDYKEVNYYWTILGFFNSIRELGGASSLVYGDIRERLKQIQNRELIYKNKRYVNDNNVEELTSRISSDKIPQVLKKLEVNFSKNKNKSLDICLATNMVATGVDISRLGLMFIHGQPKTTAEYIQASSRVGRHANGPGLIITLYSPAKPRDKSQYEQFRGYHSRIYSFVEPTSITPFSINSRERGLHAILIGLIRHFSVSLRNCPEIEGSEYENMTDIAKKIILDRCRIVDAEEYDNTKQMLEKIIEFWKTHGFGNYGDAGNNKILKNEGYVPLMYARGGEVRDDILIGKSSLPVLTSMRGVDTESVVSICPDGE